MAVTVVLVRHGKAEARRPSQTDLARHLSPKGREALEASFPRTFSLLGIPNDGDIAIWESPAVRAHETALEIQKVIDVHDVEVRDSLYEQDTEAFVGDLKARSADHDSGTVICVGHVPFMEDVATRLCGASLAFAPGAVAVIRLDRTSKRTFGKSLPGTLLWFAQGPRV